MKTISYLDAFKLESEIFVLVFIELKMYILTQWIQLLFLG